MTWRSAVVNPCNVQRDAKRHNRDWGGHEHRTCPPLQTSASQPAACSCASSANRPAFNVIDIHCGFFVIIGAISQLKG